MKLSNRISTLFIVFIFAACFFSCNVTKYVPDEEYLLNKVHVKSDVKEYGSVELNPYIKQLPNYETFGLRKTQLEIYNLSGADTTKWINRFLRKLGTPPAILDTTLVDKTKKEFTKFFINKGYINVDIEADIKTKNKKAEVTYFVKGNEPYRVRNYDLKISDPGIYSELTEEGGFPRKLNGEKSSLRNPLVKSGMLFDRDVLDQERSRITNVLRNRGYYAFDKDYITYQADSSLNANAIDLQLQLHLYPEILPSGTYAEVNHRKYYLDKVFIYTDYDPLKISLENEELQERDSIVFNNYIVYFPGKSPSIRPKVLMSHNYLTPGRTYSQLREETTYTAYSGLSALKNVQIRYEEFLRNDTAFLNTHILTMPAQKQSVALSIEGTNTAGDFGVASSINYNHRNIFKGSETLGLKFRIAYEAISNDFSHNYLDIGVETSLSFPEFKFPFLSSSFKRKMRTSTDLFVGYNYQTRPEYDRILVSGGLKYLWQGRNNSSARHQFNLLDVAYTNIPRMSDEFYDSLPPELLVYGYVDEFIVGAGYTYSNSTFNPLQRNRNVYSIKASVESAGNFLYAVSNLFNMKKTSYSIEDEDNVAEYYELFGVPYAQFIKGSIDYSRTIYLDKNNSIAWRIGGGLAYAYGNDDLVPFEKRFYSGGANSVRAWSVRTLGPGTIKSGSSYKDGSEGLIVQTGDVRLDLNLEYRTKFFWKLELAAYLDAGNIWTTRDYIWQEGGMFKFNSFYKEIALGYGLGLRVDFDYFLIRFDTGFKAYDPSKEKEDRWVFLHPNFGENFAWHFAIGYPF